MAMSPRRGMKKDEKSALGIHKERSSESSEDSDGSDSTGSPPPLTAESEGDSEDECVDNEKAAAWWLGLSDEEKNERKTCIRIHVLSPFLFGIVPRGHVDKLIDWSYECGLLPTKDVQQVVEPKNATFEAIQVVENGFEVLTSLMRTAVPKILRLKNEIEKCTSSKAAIECAEGETWFNTERDFIQLPDGGDKKMATMALILTVYHFAGHLQLSYKKKTDVLKRYNEDCNLAEEKALELKEQGNTEFSSENYRAAISRYTRAVGLSPFNHIMYGNRAQSYLKLDNYRQALIDAKRAMILKPDWDKGQYRFKQAAKALYNSEGGGASFLTFCVENDVLTAKNAPKQNGAQAAVKKDYLETTKGTIQKTEDESSEGSVPELVSADESDTSSGQSDSETKRDMPDLLDEEASDSNESGIDEGEYSNVPRGTKKNSSDDRRGKKISKSTLEILRKHNEELIKKETEKEPEQKRVPEKKPEKVEKPKKNKEVEKPVSLPERKTQIEGILREGSKALLGNCFQEAFESYGKALGFIDTASRKSLGYGDKKYVIVLYAYGNALIGLNVHKELEAAKTTFQTIITSFKTLNFPLAYYGLGRIHLRQNRFSEAIKILEKGLSVVSKSSGEIYWPGTDIVIEETKDGNLKVSFEKILTICKYPPKPDATCRFDNCAGVKKSIYCNDTDYKGYVRIICTDSCLVEYHTQCWKKLKSLNKYTDKLTDKDFLDSNCFTSSCFGHISAIQVFDTNGLKTELQSEKPKHKKEKPEKVAATEPTVGSKKKKRTKKKEKEAPNETEIKQNGIEEHEEQKCDISDEKPPAAVPEEEEKQSKKDVSIETQNVEDLSKIPESGMFVLKKDDDQQFSLPTKQAKGKNKKKKTKIVQSLDEFLGRDNENLRLRPYQHDDENFDHDEIPSEPFTRQPPEGWMSDSFSIPAHLKNDAREIENSLATFSHNSMYPNDPWKNDSIREYVYSAFINLLKAEGSLHVMSEPMRKLLNIMPEEARILVQKEGGLPDFLAKSSLFTIESDIVTNFEDKLMTDLSKPYKKPQDPPFINPKENEIGRLEKIPGPETFSFNTAPGKFGPVGSLVTNVGDALQQNTSLTSVSGTLQLNNNSKIEFPLPNFLGEQSLENLGNYSNVNKENINSSATTSTWSEKGSGLDNWANVEEFVPMQKDVNTVNTVEISDNDIVPVATGGNELKEKEDKSMDAMKIETSREITDNSASYLDKDISENINMILNDDSSDDVQGFLNERTDKASTTSEIAVLVEPKLTKDKGVQSKPSTKSKIIMTEAMNEPYKAERDKLLRSCQVLKSKYQDLVDKILQLERKHVDAVSQEKKLKDCEHKVEILTKQCQQIRQHLNHELEGLRQEKLEKNEQIKKLQEQLSSMSITEEKQIQALKAEISTLESQNRKEKQQWLSEKESVEKLKSYSQQQAKRATNAEVQLLELQRDVNFSFFTRALQEAEITFHNIAQILSVNSTPQLQELSQKWQRYIVDSKLQLNRNKLIFEASIPQLKEGKSLSSLTSLRIARPATYPGPPILHLPPGAIPAPGNKPFRGPANKPLPGPANKPLPGPANKPLPGPANKPLPGPTNKPLPGLANKPLPGPANKPLPGPANIRPEANRGPSPTSFGAPNQSTSNAIVQSRIDGIRPVGSQTVPTNQTTTNVPDRPGAEPNLKKVPEQPQKGSNSFEKIMMRLSTLFPNYSRTQMTNFIKEVRASKNGSLTGLSFDDIVACVTKLVKERERQLTENSVNSAKVAQVVTPPVSQNEGGACGFSGPKAPGTSKSSAPLPGPIFAPVKPVLTAPPKPLLGTTSHVLPPVSVAAPVGVTMPSNSNLTYEDDPCVICHDEMTKSTKNVSLDCGHTFHHDCIRKWLTGEQSTCPTCRVHALLPEEFPQLK